MDNIQNNDNAKDAVKQMVIIWAALTAGLLIFLAAVHFVVRADIETSAFGDFQFLSYFSYLIAIIALPAGYYIYDKIMKQKTGDFEERINRYRKALILKYAIFETAGFVSIAVYMLSGKTESLYILAIIIVAFLINKPSFHAFNNAFKDDDQKLSEDEF